MRKGGATILRQSLTFGLVAVFVFLPLFGYGANLREQARELSQEKEEYQEKADRAGEEAQSLAERVKLMDDQIEQIGKETKRTKEEMERTADLITQTGVEIEEKEQELIDQKKTLDEAIKYLYEEGDQPIIDTFFSSESFSEALDRTEYLEVAEEKIEEVVEEVKELKIGLEDRGIFLEIHRQGLKELKLQLEVSKELIEEERKGKNKLLRETAGEEGQYRALMAAKETEEREVLEKIWKLRGSKSGKHYKGAPEEPTGEPDRGGQPDGTHKAVFQWPLKKFAVTQEYGCTSFARCGNPRGAYGGKPHNGIDISSRSDRNGFLDLRMRAAMQGKVIMVAPEALSGGWGNAIVISHPNGLFTLYGHLSRAIVKEGQKVRKGQLIGFEGSTGFSTGRHLHFSVYMEITIYRTKWYYGPGYDFEYTLDPMIFLPKR